jgi:putative heme-binding domain-containing protein
MPAGWSEIEQAYAAVRNPDLRGAVESLSLTFGSSRALANLRETLMNTASSTDARRSALESLLAAIDTGLAPLLRELLNDASLRGAALRALAAYDNATTPAAILSVYASLNPSQKRDALNTLVSRATFARALLTAVGDGRVPRQDVTAELIRQLRKFNNEDLNHEVERVWGSIRERTEDKQQVIERFAEIYRAGGSQPGDASRGREVFSRICQQCHVLFDTGGQVGPDITGSNRGDLDYILENMLDPNAVIPNEYRTTTIDTRDDRVITGIVKAEDANAVTIVTANETLVVPRDEIASQRAGSISMMPEGLIEALSEQEVRDLIYYLSRPAQVPMPDAK